MSGTDYYSASGTSSYEVWVLTLRAWQKTPNLSLLGLPVLDESSFTPATFNRLFTHIENTINAVMASWGEALERTLAKPLSDHELSRELVNLRILLARRLQLSRHPSLPEKVRQVLEDDATRHIRALQAELESNVQRAGGGLRSDRSRAEQLLRVVRANSFVAVLTMETLQDGSVAVAAPIQAVTAGEPEPGSVAGSALPPAVRPRRWAHRTLPSGASGETSETLFQNHVKGNDG